MTERICWAAEGQYDLGRKHRVSALATASEAVNVNRYRYDSWGNVVQRLKPKDRTDETSGVVSVYDANGRFLTNEYSYNQDENGETYRVHTEVTQDSLWSKVSRFVDSAVERNGTVVVAGELFEHTFDDFGREGSTHPLQSAEAVTCRAARQ